MVKLERVGLRLLEKIDDVAILMCALCQPFVFGRAVRRWRFPAPRVGEFARLCRKSTGQRFQHQPGRARRLMHEADARSTVRFGQDLRWHVAIRDTVASRQHNGIASDAKWSFKNDPVAFASITLRIFVSLNNTNARLSSIGRDRPRELHFDIVARRIGLTESVFFRGCAVHLLELQRCAAHRVEHRLVARHTAFADRIPE